MSFSDLIVLDASAVIALILGERGAEIFTPDLLQRTVASTVNIAEVQSLLVRNGYDPALAWRDSLSYLKEVRPFAVDQARIAGTLIAKTRSRGLSLGDRSCLALAMTLKAPVYTAEHIWQGLDLDIPIHIIR